MSDIAVALSSAWTGLADGGGRAAGGRIAGTAGPPGGVWQLRRIATKRASRCLTEWVRTATGERGSPRVGLRRADRGTRCRRQRRCALQAEGQEGIRRSAGAFGRLSLTPFEERKLVNISKDQIVQLLESQGNHDKAQQAGQQLPDQVDTDNGQHADLLSKLGLDTGSLGNQLGGLGKIL